MQKIFRHLGKSIFVLFLLSALFISCGESDDGVEFLFDREILEMNILRSCDGKTDSKACYRLRFRYPIETEHLESFLVWVDTTVLKDTVRTVSKSAKANPTFEIPYKKSKASYYDTLDLTESLEDLKHNDSVQVAIWAKYSDNEDPGAVQRVFVHFGDNSPPAIVSLRDSVFSDGAAFDWSRPTDQTDFYAPESISGKIAGYNIVIYALNESEDIRKANVKIIHAGMKDSLGETLYARHSRFKSIKDSVWLDETSSGNAEKRYLRLAVFDGEGFSEIDSLNRFRLILTGLKPESKYTIGITSYDSSGNYSGSLVSAESNQMFITTDKIAPLMPTKIFTLEDSTSKGMARLDSNNRVRIFWSRSVDPFSENHGIVADTTLFIPDTCHEFFCYRGVASYHIERLLDGKWETLSLAGGSAEERYNEFYRVSSDTMEVSSRGTFVTDTIRWVSPGDTLILRIRSIDSSGYYSKALIDTIYVTLNDTLKLSCPEGFLPIASGDSSAFCMEKFEHRDSDGEFMRNVLYSEAVESCKSISADGFSVSLCAERDWEIACLTNGLSSYGVIEEETLSASEYLYTICNVATNDSLSASQIESRNYKCANAFGVRDLPGNYQEWTKGREENEPPVLKGSSYKTFDGLDRESIALCTNRFFPYYTRQAFVKDTTVYLYRSGTVVDTTLQQDTTRTLYKKLTQKDFKDSLQFFAVKNPATGEIVGYDYATIEEYRKGGKEWLENLAGEMIYEEDHIEIVFLLGSLAPYREVGRFYRNSSISFRCCAYPK